MPSTYFTRYASNQFVLSTNGNSKIYFDSNFGGAPLIWQYPKSGTLTDIIASPAGLGFQSVTEEGQDITQAGCNGITVFPIARTGIDNGSELAYRNYWARETTAGFPTGITSLDIYQVQGFFPDFWQSGGGGAADDSIPENDHGVGQYNWPPATGTPGTGWVTGYTSTTIFNTPYSGNTWGTPVYFSPYTDSPNQIVTSGILMEGNEQIVPGSVSWNSRLRSIPYGRVAFRIKVSLSNASDDAYVNDPLF